MRAYADLTAEMQPRLHFRARFDYESFTKTCFPADMNWVRGRPWILGAVFDHDHGAT